MKAETVVNYRLSNDANITAIVGTSPARVYMDALPQDGTAPCIVFKKIASRRISGWADDPGAAFVTIQVTSCAHTAAAVAALNEAVRVSLERYGFSVTGTLISGVKVYDIKIGTEASVFDPDTQLYMHATDYIVEFEE